MTRARNHITFLIAGIILSISCCFSQVEQSGRYEKEQKFNDENFTVISLKEDGLVLIREKNKYKSGNKIWEVILLDTALQETAALDVDIEIRNQLIGYEHSAGEVHFLFMKNETKGYMDLLSLSLASKEFTRYEIKPELNLQLTHFCKVGENYVFGGFVDRESAILMYSPAIANLKIIPGFFQRDIELIDMRVNQNQTFNTLLFDRSDSDNKKLIFKMFDSFGKQLLEDIVTIDSDMVLHTGISSMLERDDMIITGTWGKVDSKQASGFYVLPVDPFEDQKINRFYFGQLEHYLDYLKPKRANVIKSKTTNAIERGKIPDFSNYVMPFRMVEHPEGFLLLAESYNPSASSSNQPVYTPYSYAPYYSPFGGYYPSNRVYYPRSTAPTYGTNVENSEEIKAIESAVLAFNGKGTLLWDQSFKLTQIKMESLSQVSDFHLKKDSVIILYKNESELKIKTANLDDNQFVERSVKIKLNDTRDELRGENKQLGLIKHWFGRNFYVWGNQSIRNKTNPGNRNREVFYINKVIVH